MESTGDFLRKEKISETVSSGWHRDTCGSVDKYQDLSIKRYKLFSDIV